ncbi:hypothetical protein ACG7TL_007036 [Trametes sanguinea]
MQSPSACSQARSASRTSTPTLPRLPVPDLHKTLQKYLKSLEPFLLEDESRGGSEYGTAYDTRVKLVNDFEQGIGKLCQQRLLELDKQSPNNWLDDNIWLKKAYHEWRAPLIVNSNWWLALGDDRMVPRSVRHPAKPATGFTAWQVRRAAWLTHRVLDFRSRLERQETLLADVQQAFGFTMRPFSPTDTDARKLLVMVAGWMYAIDVLTLDGTPLPPALIEARLHAVISDTEARRLRGEHPVDLSILTTDERDRWADNLAHILALSPSNQKIHRTITRSVFALSLDDYESRRTSDPDLTAHLHNIRSGHGERPGYNRWYDKPFTLIVEANTRAGVLGEHSPVDALVPSIIADYAIVQEVDEDAFGRPLGDDGSPPPDGSSADDGVGWERLDWVVDEHIVSECGSAAIRAKTIVDDSDNDELVFNSYGVDWIKNDARLSPDAYIQLAMQLAWYRTRGEFTATYETVLTRLFKHGRTETIRTFTADARAWVLAMMDPGTSADTRLSLLRRALQTHTQLTREAATGRGIDRHLLGLRLMLRADAGERHGLFEDELFTRSQTWKLSTSGLSAGYQFRGTGFGASYDDGYGINYMPAPDNIRFGIESKHSCPQTSTQLFKTAIADALQDMRALCTPTLHSHL